MLVLTWVVGVTASLQALILYFVAAAAILKIIGQKTHISITKQ